MQKLTLRVQLQPQKNTKCRLILTTMLSNNIAVRILVSWVKLQYNLIIKDTFISRLGIATATNNKNKTRNLKGKNYNRSVFLFLV